MNPRRHYKDTEITKDELIWLATFSVATILIIAITCSYYVYIT